MVIVVVAIVVVVICVGAVVVALAEDLLHVTVGAEASLPMSIDVGVSPDSSAAAFSTIRNGGRR